MDMLITPDCPQCHGKGHAPFKDSPLNSYPCGQCCRRWDLANPPPSPKFMATNMTMAKFTKMLRRANENVRGAFSSDSKAAHDSDLWESHVDDLEWLLSTAADFIESHDPSAKKQLSEAEAPYCPTCSGWHPPIPDGCKGW